MSLWYRILAILIIGMVASCSKPVVDTSTDTSTTSSIQKVRASLPKSERIKFDEALREIVRSHQSISAIISGQSESSIRRQALSEVNGKDGEQIIADGERIKAKREAKEK